MPQLKKRSDQAWVLNELGNSYSNSGQIFQSIPAYKIAITLTENMRDFARTAGNLATDQLDIGMLRKAEDNFTNRINLFREIQKKFDEGIGHAELGRFLSYIGLWDKAGDEFPLAIELFEKVQNIQYIGVVWAYRALHFMLMARSDLLPKPEILKSALECAKHSLEAAEETAQKEFHAERDFIRAHWMLGAAYRLDERLELAESHLNEALGRCRAINAIVYEANILLDLSRLRYDQKNYEEAKSLAEEALSITERCGYVLQGADVNLFLAQYALEQEKDEVKAKEYAESALKLAYCDGPPYYYKVAYEEAKATLERLNV